MTQSFARRGAVAAAALLRGNDPAFAKLAEIAADGLPPSVSSLSHSREREPPTAIISSWRRLLSSVPAYFIMLGMAGLLMLIPLALTSNQWSIRRLGPRWNKLHKLTYPILLVAILHYALSLKVIDPEAAFYIVVTIVLLGYRLVRPKIMERRRAKRGMARAR